MGSKRVTKSNENRPEIIFSTFSGSERNSDVGNFLKPIAATPTTFTTDCTTSRAIPPGCSLAVYNNASAVGSITLGTTSAQASLAPGVTDTNGRVGIPIPPNSYLRIATWDQNFVIASAATLIVMVIASDDKVVATSNPNA